MKLFLQQIASNTYSLTNALIPLAKLVRFAYNERIERYYEDSKMEALSANEAKIQFGGMLLKAQRAPVQINKNGKPVAVVISMDEYESTEILKLQLLQARAAQAKVDVEAGNTLNGESLFDDIKSGKFD